MDTSRFQSDVKRTLNGDLTGEETILNAAMGIGAEAGEVQDFVKKWRFQNHELDVDSIVKELGDVLYYVTLMADQLSYGLDEVMWMNMEKRAKRYPNGFETERSLSREGE